MAKLVNGEKAFATIRKYDKKGDFNVGHDAVYAGGPRSHPDRMQPLDRAMMKRLGWQWDDATESWVKFV